MPDVSTALPHFIVQTLDGRTVRYTDLWQQRNLILLVLPADPPPQFRRYAAELSQIAAALVPQDTACVITTAAVGRYVPITLVIADRWGEVRAVYRDALPPLEDVEASVQHVRMSCPECEGEWK